VGGPRLWSSGDLDQDPKLVLVGAGGLMSFRTGWSMLFGAMSTYVVIARRCPARMLKRSDGKRVSTPAS